MTVLQETKKLNDAACFLGINVQTLRRRRAYYQRQEGLNAECK